MFKKIIKSLQFVFLFFGFHGPAWACISCNRSLQVSVFDANFWKNSFYMILPFLVIGAIIFRIYKLK